MRIGFFITTMNSGGAERVMSLLVNHFVVNNFEVHLFIFSNDKIFYKLNESVIIHHISSHENSFGVIGTIFKQCANIIRAKRIVKLYSLDCLVSFTTIINCVTIVLGKLGRLPVIISERNEPIHYNPGFLANLLRKTLYRYATSIILQTQRSEESFNKLNIKLPRNRKVIFNPIDNSFRNQNLGRKSIILAVGRQSHEKGHDLLISAFALANLSEWELHLVGEGAERNNLVKLSEELGISDKIIWHGKQQDIAKFLNLSSIFILPSRTEGFPNALCEAMLCGCAVISFDCPNGPSELINNNENGILVENENIVAMSNAIKQLTEDRQFRTTLGLKASLMKNILSKDVICNQWQLHLGSLLKKGKK